MAAPAMAAPARRPASPGVEVDVDAKPYLSGRHGNHLDRSVSTGDSGYNGVDDADDNASDSSSDVDSSVPSEAGTGGRAMACVALRLGHGAPSLAAETISVERSRHVQVVGNSTHYHYHYPDGDRVLSAQQASPPSLCAPTLSPPTLSPPSLSPPSLFPPTLSPPIQSVDPPADAVEPAKTKTGEGAAAPWRRVLVRVAVAGLLVLGVGAVVLWVFVYPRSEAFSDAGDIVHLRNGVNLAYRAVWGAQPAMDNPVVLSTPVETVIVHHTGTEPCFNLEECSAMLLTMQVYHIYSAERQWGDIGYNFLVGGDGLVYEGRGWDVVGAYLEGWNSRALGVALVGSFTAAVPSTLQRDQLGKFLRWGVELGKITRAYRLVGACQLQATKSPGLRFMEDLRTWEHWWNHTEVAKACAE